jgi:acyl-CoA reductase-like NAD-dependent aldehyde dehydrogenase
MAEFDPFAAQFFLDHDFVASANQVRLEIINPATLEKVGVVARCDDAEVDRMVARANEVQRDWARTDAKTRASLLHQVADSIERTDFRPVAEIMTLEMGKPYAEAVGELANVAPVYRYFAAPSRPQRCLGRAVTQYSAV